LLYRKALGHGNDFLKPVKMVRDRRIEPALIEQLLEVRRRLVETDLGTGIAPPYWGRQ